MFFLLKQTIKAAIPAASGASCTESRTEYAEVFSPEAVKEAEVSSPTPVLDPWEGTSQQQTDEVSEILSALEDDVSESEKESMKDCVACGMCRHGEQNQTAQKQAQIPSEEVDCCKEGAFLFAKDRYM